jgi:iron complex outermembrane receptor protein
MSRDHPATPRGVWTVVATFPGVIARVLKAAGRRGRMAGLEIPELGTQRFAAAVRSGPTPTTMTHHHRELRAAVSHLRGAATAALLLAPAFAWAQAATSQPAEETLKLEKFVVTGSLIPIAADTPAVPIAITTAEDIERSGVTRDLTDVLKKVNPFFFGRGNLGAENANTRANGTNGASTVALRNRPTLVLINGRRAALAPVAATGGATFIDVSLVPVTAVERVEVLADGASATYGTDAVSGVVNIILKSNYRGAEIGGTYSWAPNAGNYAARRAYATMGAGDDKTQVTVTAEWRRTDPLYQYERPWGKNQFRTPSFAGVITLDNGSTYYHLNPNLNAPPQNLDLPLADLIAAGYYSGPYSQDQVAQFFDLSEKATMFQRTNRRALTAAAEHRWADNLTAFADIIVTSSETESSLNAQPVAGNVAGNNPFNPLGVSVNVRNRFVDFPRIRNSEALGVRGVAGLKGTFGNTWNWELAASLNRTTQNVRQFNLIDTAAYNAAIANGTYNPFARRQAAGVIEGMLGTGFQDFVSRLNGFDARFSGELMDLPAGALQLGVALETRREAISMMNDRNDQTGAWLQATPTNPFAARQTVDGFGAEVRVPVFGAAQSVPFFHSLEVTLAGRKEIYSSTTDPFVPKYSLRWMPFNDELVVRATYGESFNAPALFSLFGPSNSGFTNSININRYDSAGNLIGPTGQRQYRSRGGSNPNLIPAESRNWTAGVVWSPRAIKGFSIALDWFDIDERNIVGVVPITTLLQSVEQFGAASPYAHQVRLGTSVAGETHFTDGAPITAPGQITSGASDAVWVTNPALNIAGQWQSGADLRVDYTHDTKTWGRLDATMALTYIKEFVVQTLPTSAPFNGVDGFSASSTLPRYRTFTNLDWTFKHLTVGLSHTWIPEVDDLVAPVPARIEAYHTFDLRAGYTFSGSSNAWLRGLRLSAGVNNLLDEDPPLILGEQDQGRDINTYDAIGRLFFVSASYKF